MSSYMRVVLIVALTALLITGCVKEEPKETVEKIRQVSTVIVNKESYKETITYTGFVTARQILPMSFQQNGIVGEVKVTEGQNVKAGDALVTLEKNVETIYASFDGIVSEIFSQPGDVVGAGYPVLILRSVQQILKVGVTDVDLVRIEEFGNPVVTVELDDKSVEAELDDINRMPDEMSRTYTVTVMLDEKENFLMGKLGIVTFELARIGGIWLSINHIQNDGEDYVFIVNTENRVERRNLKLKELYNDLVRVEGLEDGDRIITVGNAIVKEGQQVTVREATNE